MKEPLAKLVAAPIYKEEKVLEEFLKELEKHFSRIDSRSSPFSFTHTQYYEKEMGNGLFRSFFSFEQLVSPAYLLQAKLITWELEKQFSRENKRQVNLDVGTLDFSRFVLASFKEGRHKIYLGEGVWADLTLFLEKKNLVFLPWTFPDYQAGIYDDAFFHIRGLFKQQMKNSAAKK